MIMDLYITLWLSKHESIAAFWIIAFSCICLNGVVGGYTLANAVFVRTPEDWKCPFLEGDGSEGDDTPRLHGCCTWALFFFFALPGQYLLDYQGCLPLETCGYGEITELIYPYAKKRFISTGFFQSFPVFFLSVAAMSSHSDFDAIVTLYPAVILAGLSITSAVIQIKKEGDVYSMTDADGSCRFCLAALFTIADDAKVGGIPFLLNMKEGVLVEVDYTGYELSEREKLQVMSVAKVCYSLEVLILPNLTPHECVEIMTENLHLVRANGLERPANGSVATWDFSDSPDEFCRGIPGALALCQESLPTLEKVRGRLYANEIRGIFDCNSNIEEINESTRTTWDLRDIEVTKEEMDLAVQVLTSSKEIEELYLPISAPVSSLLSILAAPESKIDFIHLGREPMDVNFSARLWDFLSLSALSEQEYSDDEVELIVASAIKSPRLSKLQLAMDASTMIRIFEGSTLTEINNCTRKRWDFRRDDLDQPQIADVVKTCHGWGELKHISFGAMFNPQEMVTMFHEMPNLEQVDGCTRSLWDYSGIKLLEYEKNTVARAVQDAKNDFPTLREVKGVKFDLTQCLTSLGNPNMTLVDTSTRETWDFASMKLTDEDVPTIAAAHKDPVTNAGGQLKTVLMKVTDVNRSLGNNLTTRLPGVDVRVLSS